MQSGRYRAVSEIKIIIDFIDSKLNHTTSFQLVKKILTSYWLKYEHDSNLYQISIENKHIHYSSFILAKN